MTRALVVSLIIVVAGSGVRGAEVPAELPEGWSTLTAGELIEAFDALWAEGTPPDEGTQKAIADYVWDTFLGSADFVSGSDPAVLLGLADRMAGPLGQWYTEERRESLATRLATRIASDPAVLTAGEFDEAIRTRWEPALRAGLAKATVAEAANGWMQGHEWRSLEPTDLSRLVRIQEDGLVDRLRYSMRWSGALRPHSSGTYTLSQSSRGGHVQVWLSGELRIDSEDTLEPETPGDQDISRRSVPLVLSEGDEYPLRVEYSFDADVAFAKDPTIEGPKELFYGWSRALLLWETETMPLGVIPSDVLVPPEGFEQGAQGLKAECYRGDSFQELAQTRLDPEVSLAIIGRSPASAYYEDQRAAKAEAVWRLLSAQFLSREDISPLFWATRDLLEYLTMQERKDLLLSLAANPRAMRDVPAGELWHFQKGCDYLPGDESTDVVASWCTLEPVVPAAFGAYPGWVLEFPCFNHANYGGYWHMARHIRTPSERAKLLSVLSGEDGRCNERVGRLLGFVHKEAGESAQWCAFLDAKLSEETLRGDPKVGWLVMRAYAEELRDKGEPVPMAGREWLEEALAAAESEPVRLRVLGELAARLAAWGKAQELDSLLESLSGQFESEEARASFTRWRDEASQIEEHYAAQERAQKEGAFAAYVEELERRLESARASGAAYEVSRYQTLLEAAQSAEAP